MVEIRDHYIPGCIGRITQLHAEYYAKEWGFGLYFEAKVARELSDFLQRYDPKQDGIWLLLKEKSIEGSIIVDGQNAQTKGAHLRWFIISQELRGMGWGNKLLSKAMEFSKGKGYKSVYLWTFEGLYPARHLYEKFRFRLRKEQEGEQWGKRVLEQLFTLDL